jgi:hypothetical protein
VADVDNELGLEPTKVHHLPLPPHGVCRTRFHEFQIYFILLSLQIYFILFSLTQAPFLLGRAAITPVKPLIGVRST